nr:Mariner Mos1 transposase [Hymenolepis microstoma]
MQLMRRLSRAQQKCIRPQYNERHDKVVILQHDNTRSPHNMGQSGGKISRNGEMGNFTSPATVLSRCCSVCSFSPHSPRSMAHQHFSSYEEVVNWIVSWNLSKDDKFVRRGIRLLPER